MTTKTLAYANQCLAGSGFAVIESVIAWQLRSDLWPSCRDCRMSLRADVTPDGAQRLIADIEGIGPVLVLSRSLDRLAERIEWVIGRRVLSIAPEPPKVAPDLNALRMAAGSRAEAARLDALRKFAAQEPPTHDCALRREILAARQELDRRGDRHGAA